MAAANVVPADALRGAIRAPCASATSLPVLALKMTTLCAAGQRAVPALATRLVTVGLGTLALPAIVLSTKAVVMGVSFVLSN